MLEYILKGIIIGLLFGVPIGVVGILTVQRTMDKGFLIGFLSALGASCADVFYAAITLFGITFISDFLISQQDVLSIIGGIIIIVMGYHIYKGKSTINVPKKNIYMLSGFLSSFLITLTNPVSILTFMLVFSSFGIQGQESYMDKIGVIWGIFIGTGLWWFTVAFVSHIFKEKVVNILIARLHKLCAILLIIVGFVFILRGSI